MALRVLERSAFCTFGVGTILAIFSGTLLAESTSGSASSGLLREPRSDASNRAWRPIPNPAVVKDCECSVIDDWCLWGEDCRYGETCKQVYECGWYWLERCDGTCQEVD